MVAGPSNEPSVFTYRRLLRPLTPFTRISGRAALLWLIAVTLVVFGTDRLAARLLDIRHGLNAVYFPGPEWQGSGSTAVDTLPSTSVLKRRRPDFVDHPFSVTWSGFIFVPRRGTYTFATVSDDGSWLYVRGQEVVKNVGRHQSRETRGSIVLESGVYPIFIRYFQGGGDCALELLWAREGHALEPLPAWALLTDRVSYGRLLTRGMTSVAMMLVVVAWYAILGSAFVVWVLWWAGQRSHSRQGSIDLAFGSVLLVSLLLNVWGIWWAMPNTRGWAPDELVPTDVLYGLRQLFSHGWSDKYPPFHYAVLSAMDSPILLLSWLGVVDLQATGPYLGLVVIGRFVSVALGAATIGVVYRCGRELYGPCGAVFAALTTALMAPFAYYGKLANVDVPYVFWFAVSLLAYIRILQRHERRDYLLFGASAAFAVCTKDQAYGLYVLTPLAILVARWRRWRQAGRPVVHILFDGTTMGAVGVTVGILLVADNLLLNFGGFTEHLKVILGPANLRYQMFPATVAGQVRMAWLAILELCYMFGWPLAVIVAVAVARGIAGTTTPSLRWLLVPALSYYATFIGIVLYFFDRFLLPIGLMLSLFVGYWLERFIAPGVPARRSRIALVSAAFAYSVIYVATVDYAMTSDSRYAVTRWMKAHAGRTQLVTPLGAPLEYFMLADGFASASVESVEDIAAIKPVFIVLSVDQIASLPPGHLLRTTHDALLDGRAGYRLALRYRTPSLPWPGQHPDLGAMPRHTPELSSFSEINPTMEVFERADLQSTDR